MADELNGIPVAPLLEAREAARDGAALERGATVVAEWMGADTSRVRLGEVALDVAGPGRLDAMQLVLAALAACEVDTIATRAALRGVRVASLSVEVSGSFDVRAYLGVAGAPGPGYGEVRCTVRLRAPDATPADLTELRDALADGSPVADTLRRTVAISFELVDERDRSEG